MNETQRNLENARSNAMHIHLTNSSRNQLRNLQASNSLEPKKNNIIKDKIAQAALKKVGVPTSVSKKLIEESKKQGGKSPIPSGIMPQVGALNFLDRMFGGVEARDKMSDGGILSFKISGKSKIYIAVIAGFLGFMLLSGIFLMISSNVYESAKKLSHSNSASKIESKIDEMDPDDMEKANEDLGTIYRDYTSSNLVPVARKVTLFKQSELDDLEDFYPLISQYDDEYDIQTVYKFFFKLYYIQKHYKEKYKVDIDLPLLMSTLIIQSDDMSIVFSKNTKNYHYSTKENNKYFKFDYNWTNYIKKISYDNSEHDIEVLVQHMVSKQVKERCLDSSGNEVSSNILYDEKDGAKVLECNDGETYESGEPVYEVDDDKYKEFLREFLEKKYYLDPKSADYTEPETPTPETPTPETPTPETPSQESPGNQGNIGSEYASRMINIALNEVGNLGTKYKTEYGLGYGCAQWCVIFSWWLSNEVGIYPNIMPFKEISTGALMRDFVNSNLPNIKFYYNTSCELYPSSKNNGVNYIPKPGDFAFFDWEGSPAWTPTNDTQEHTGVVLEVSSDGKRVTTINGNFGGTGSDCSFSQSSTVKERTDSLSNCQIIGFGSWY